MSTSAPALALDGITKRFGAVAALRDVSFQADAGQVHALLGENGAGKTTLMHVAFGLVKPDRGAIRIAGAQRPIHSPADAIAAGLGMVHQHFTLVPAMSVTENLTLGGRGLLRPRAMTAAVHEIGARTGFALDPDARVEDLTVGAQQRVEIAKALMRRARVLILDEPTAVLAPAEADDLLRWLRRYADAGNAVVLITHKLNEALAIADRATVLRQGRVAYAGSAADTSAYELTTAMVGHAVSVTGENAPRPAEGDQRVVFRASGITFRDAAGNERLRPTSLVVRAGEILGIAGVEGAGQRELLRLLAGRLDVSDGTLERPERVGFVPEDRHHDAVLLDRSLTDNVALRDAARRRGRMPWRTLRARTHALMRDLDVRAVAPESVMRALSGGNQQKLVLGREMDAAGTELPAPGALDRSATPMALVAENPTRGLDVGATADVHARLRAAREQGAAIVLFSSDLDEVLALATRIVVLHAGTAREVPLDREAVGRAMLGIA